MENKEIRFIDSQYNELFRIKDGESIEITLDTGEKVTRECKYIDDYHTQIGNNCYHICEFAELMERNGNTYCPNSLDGEEIQKYKDLQFVEKNYGEIDKDKFFKTDSGVTEIYFNPDSNAGGQFVELTISMDDIKDAAKRYKNPSDFFSYLEGITKGTLCDVGTDGFMNTAKNFMISKADFEGCTAKTMKELKKYAGVEKSKSAKEPER